MELTNRQIETATKNKSNFLANMSHELRTPLNGILGYAEIIIDGVYGKISPEVERILNDQRENGRNLLQIINDILDLSKVEAGKMELNQEEFSPSEAAELVVGKLIGEAEKRGIKVEGEYEKDLPIGWGDKRRVGQILETLLKNAIYYSKAKEIKVWVKIKSVGLCFVVEDDGIGMPEERMETIFEEHELPANLEVKDYQGVSLGLNLARRFVELHGGELKVESKAGVGSKFSFGLPLKEKLAKVPEEEFREVEYSHMTPGIVQEIELKELEQKRHLYEDLKGKRILSIEDNPTNRKILHDLLVMHDCEVIEAVTGKEGLNKAKSEQPDIIITDLQLPEMSGLDAIKEIRKSGNQEIREIPIIVASASAMPDDVKRGFEYGANIYISKPYNFKEVLDSIKKLVK